MWLYKSLHFFWRFILQYLLMSAWNKCTRVETYLRAFRRPSTLSAGWSFRTLMQPFIWNDQSPRFSKVKKQQYSKLCCVRIGLNMSALHLFWRTCWRRRWGGRGHRGWWPRPWLSCRTRPCPRCWNDSSNLWEHNKIRSYRLGFEKPLEHNGKKWIYEVFCIFSLQILLTHGVSNMTLQTLAMVLRQSVVFSSGRVLFWRIKTNPKTSKLCIYLSF